MLCRKADVASLPRAVPHRACTAALLTWALLASLAALHFRHSGPAPPCCPTLRGWMGQDAPDVEVVLAHFNENVTWLQPLVDELGGHAALTVYSKGKGTDPPPGSIQLPNVGREGHTYLHHLHSRYDSLARVTLFLMGSAGYSEDKAEKLAELRRHWQQAQQFGFFCAGLDFAAPKPGYTQRWWAGTTEVGSGARLKPASPRPFGRWFAEFVGGELPRAWCPAAMMAVHRSRVRHRPRSFYKTLLAQMSAGPNLEAGHFLERSWASLFFMPEATGCTGSNEA